MELLYKKEMEKHGLSVAELPEDAQTGIENINDVLKAFRMVEKKGQKPTDKALKKLRAMDKWVLYEIYDYLNDTDKNDDDIPFDAEDVIDDVNSGKKDNDDNSGIEADPLGLKIESELETLYTSGKKLLTIDEIQDNAPQTYSVLFDAYEDGEQNGIITSKYSLIEGTDRKFTLKTK